MRYQPTDARENKVQTKKNTPLKEVLWPLLFCWDTCLGENSSVRKRPIYTQKKKDGHYFNLVAVFRDKYNELRPRYQRERKARACVHSPSSDRCCCSCLVVLIFLLNFSYIIYIYIPIVISKYTRLPSSSLLPGPTTRER